MSDAYIGQDTDSESGIPYLKDMENVGTQAAASSGDTKQVYRERIVLGGSARAEIVDVSNTTPALTDYGLLVRQVGPGDSMLDISEGNVSGMVTVNKFGRAPTGVQTTATDIWDRADATPTQQVWTAPTQARTHSIVSTSDEDSDTGGSIAQGDGARTIRVYGLTDWDTAETSEDITMDGTTAVNTANSYVIIHRMKVLTAGTSPPNVGTITATAATDTTVTAQINIGEGQTQMAIYGIPSTQTAHMVQWYGTINKASGAAATINFSVLVNDDPSTDVDLFLIKNTRGVQSTGNSGDTWTFNPYYAISGPAIIKVQGIASAADAEGSAGFDLILVDD